MKVFLSHSTQDGAFAEKLAGPMKAEDFDPWLSEARVKAGENWVVEIERGLSGADLVLLLWSKAAAGSEFTLREWTAALDREISERRLRLGIVLVADCELPQLLRTKQFIDARRDLETGISNTLAWLKARRDAGRHSGSKAPVCLPDYNPQSLVGRGEYMERLRDAIVDQPSMFLLNGEPGCGKSILALMFAWAEQKHFDAVVYQTCGQRGVDAIAGELADKLREQLGDGVTQLAPDKKLDAVKRWLKQRRSLLVLDDVWLDGAPVENLFPGAPVSVLATSRRRTLPWLAQKQISRVESFTVQETEDVFRAYLGQETVDHHRWALLEFANRVDRLPIAVTVGADLLRRQFGPLDQAARKLALGKLRDVDTLFAGAIESQDKSARRLLGAAAVCAPEGFWLPLAIEIAGLDGEDGEDARDNLVNASLLRVIDQDRQRFQLHALLRERLRANTDSEKELSGVHVAALERRFKDHETKWKECRECLEEIIPAGEYLWSQDEISRQGRLSFQAYSCARRIGELDAALRIVKCDEAFWANNESRESKDRLRRAYGDQAVILRDWGRLDEGFALHKKEEAICLQLGNQDGLQISYGNQGLILQAWGRLDEALALQRKKEAICLQLGNKDHLQRSYGCQGLILQAWGQLDKALALQKKKEAICLELGDKNDLQRSYGNQALILEDWGRLDEALALHKKKEAICLELGNKNSLQVSYGNQANILKTWGRFDEALALHKKEEAICLELGNKDGLQISYGNQAVILKNCGRLDEALSLHRKQEAICLDLGLRIGLGYCYWSWGLLARARKDEAAAKEKLEAALAIFTTLQMPRERDEVQAELSQSHGAGV